MSKKSLIWLFLKSCLAEQLNKLHIRADSADLDNSTQKSTGWAKFGPKHKYLVLTDTSASKLFGDEPALGKAVKFDWLEYQVSDVMEDIPLFSLIGLRQPAEILLMY